MPNKKVSRFSAINSDVDEIRQHYAETLKPVRVDPMDGSRTISAHDLHMSVGGFDIWAGGCPSGMKVSFTEPPDLYALYIPLSGTMEFNRGKSTVTSAPGTIFACDLASIDSIVLHPQRSHIGIAFDKKMAAEQLGKVTGDSSDLNVNMFNELKIAGDGEGLDAMCKLVWQTLESNPEKSIQQKSNEMLLRTIMLKLFENLNYKGLSDKRHSPAMPRHVKIAIEYMTAHIRMPIAIDDIAAAAGVSSRALQLAFQQFKGTTPLSYLRQLRMQQARIDLLAAKEGDGTVADIAKRWGFSNVARFTALYLHIYGESPKHTIER